MGNATGALSFVACCSVCVSGCIRLDAAGWVQIVAFSVGVWMYVMFWVWGIVGVGFGGLASLIGCGAGGVGSSYCD